jgi:4-diphosphocytidyl-2-C-methyl-D-erythritol kinase
MKLKIRKNDIKKLAEKIGFDVPINLERKNTFLTGINNKIIRINKKYNFNLLIVYPNLICSTKMIYNKNKKITLSKSKNFLQVKQKEKLINLLVKQSNDLQDSVVKIYPEIKKIIDYIKSQQGCYFSRITGSGSACIGIFTNMKSTIYAQKLIKIRYPNYWCVTSKTI